MNRPGRLVAAVVLAVALAGCGSEVPPGEAVPELRQELSLVDEAVVAGDYGRAREALDELARRTVAARESGQLTAEQADPVLAAIARLAADLPGADPATPEPDPTTREAPPRTTSAPEDSADPTSDATQEPPPSDDGGQDEDGGDGDGDGDDTSGDGDGGSSGENGGPEGSGGNGGVDGGGGPGSGGGDQDQDG